MHVAVCRVFGTLTYFGKMSCCCEPPAKPIQELLSRCNILTGASKTDTRSRLLSAEFRACRTMYQQIDILRHGEQITWQALSILFQIPQTTLYDAYKLERDRRLSLEESNQAHQRQQFPHSALTFEEENAIIEWVNQRQANFDCPTILEVREYATSLLRRRLPKAPLLSRTWWKSYRRRHLNRIKTEMIQSRETNRANVPAERVREYFGKLHDALRNIKHPSQILNMDESGFQSRIDKGRLKKCVCSTTCETPPKFRPEQSSTQLSVISAIAMDGQMLETGIITQQRVTIESEELHVISQYMKFFVSTKGYQTEDTMLGWIREILVPYCVSVRKTLNDPTAKMYLLMDNCSVHNTGKVQQEFARIDNFEIIWLPPNSTHFLQQLDANFFGVMKSYYRSLKTPTTTPRICGKVIRAFQAIWDTCKPINIIKCWEMTGFTYENIGTSNMTVKMNSALIEELIRSNCPNAHHELQ